MQKWWMMSLIGLVATAGADVLVFHTETVLRQSGAEGTAASVTATVAMPGRLFDPPVVIEPGGVPYEIEDSPINTSKLLWEAFISDDERKILSHWAQADRPLVRTVLADGEVRALNRQLLQTHQRKQVFGVVEMDLDQPYRLLLVRHDQDPRELGEVEAYVLEQGAWRATHALVENEQFDTVWKAFRSGEITSIDIPQKP